MTNRPNRGWRIRGNTARAVIKRKSDPLEITMALGVCLRKNVLNDNRLS